MPRIDRRDFLKLVGAGGAAGAVAGFMLRKTMQHPVEHLVPYPVPPEEWSAGIATWYNSVCGMCPAGCGITVKTREGRAKKIEGNPVHPVNQGGLCALGQAGLQVLYNPDRITTPLVRNDAGEFVKTSWDDALNRAATGLSAARSARIAFLSEGVRGHLADVYERFITALRSDQLHYYDPGHPHNLYAAQQRLFGESALPYYDLANAHMVVSFGADFLGHWLSPVHHGLGFANSRHGDASFRGRFVQIEPRMSVSGAAADEWIPARPGTEGILALGMAHRIVAEGGYSGPDRGAWASALGEYTPDHVASLTGVDAATVNNLADAFARSQPALAIGGGTAAEQTNGVDALVAINALNYLVGNIGKPGGLIFNPEPAFGTESQARQASYDDLVKLSRAARAGGRVEALIVSGANPVFTLPRAAKFREALDTIPLVISLSSFMDETTAMADIVLPSHTYLESWGDDTPSPGVGFGVGAVRQPVVAPLYDTRASGDTVMELARIMGKSGTLRWPNMQERIKDGWREIFERGSREIAESDFESFWNAVLEAGVWGERTHRGRQSAQPDPAVVAEIGVAEPAMSGEAGEFPFVLHPYPSTAFRDGRGANLPWMQELPDPLTSVVYGSWVEMNPQTAADLGLEDGSVVEIKSGHGRLTATVLVYPAIRPDVIAIPIGQGHEQFGRYAQQRGVNPLRILAPETDPATGSLATGATRVNITNTGRRARLVRTGGLERQLGREIIQTTGGTDGHHASATPTPLPIPIKVKTS